jgi:cell division protein FtsQ
MNLSRFRRRPRQGQADRVRVPAQGKQVAALSELLDAAPALRPQVREAEWVGNRRWNLTFKTGQVLALPEGARTSRPPP